MASSEIQLVISARDETLKAFNSVKGSLESVGIDFKKMATAGAVAFGAISAEVGLSLKAFAGAEVEMAKVNAIMETIPQTAIKSAGGMDKLKTSIDDLSRSNIKLGFDDEDTSISMARLMQTTGSLTEATKLNAMAMDLARFKNVDLGTATTALMKMNAGSTKELKMMGIELDDNATKEDAFRIIMEKTAGQAKAYSETIQGKTEAMKISMANLQEGIGQALAPAFTKLVEAVLPVIEKFSKWAEENPKLLATILVVVGAIAGLVGVVGAIGLIIPSIITGISMLGVAFAVLTGPVGLVILGITALIAVGVLVYKNWETIQSKAVEIWTAISNWFVEAFNNIKNFFTTIWNSIADYFTQVWETIKMIFSFAVAFIAGLVILAFKAMGIDIIAVFESIKVFLAETWEWIKVAFSVALTFISNLWNTVWGAVSGFFVEKFDSIKTHFSEVLKWISNVLKIFIEPFQKLWESLWGAVGGTVQRVFDGVMNIVKGMLNWVIDKINALINAANSVAQIGASIGIKPPTIPTLPRLAKGGIVNKPTIAMIGEAGPEAVIPLSRGGGRVGRMGDIIINVTNNTIQTADDLTELVDKGIREALRLNNQLSY